MLFGLPIPWAGLVGPFLFLLAIFSFAFLFWRAGEYEYIETELLFDILIIWAIGALVFARLFDFVFNFASYGWSLPRLIFFNVYGGFDAWGALFGAFFSGFLFLRKKKIFFSVFDLAAAPAVFGLFIYSLGNLMRGGFEAIGYFAVFCVLKRLEVHKRHKGFFACFAVVSTAAVSLIFYRPDIFDFRLLRPVGFLILCLAFWYILAKRSVKRDFKNILGFLLLVVFGARRVLTNVGEADKFARDIILFPFYFGKVLLFFVRLIAREIYLGTLGMVKAIRGYK
ncbi:prolipoprotein diacylglyceryl transferase [Candidatus Curtissbacteria bacterium]|nr:prolipoprotein diacylglyceryl transferase [Candidatus Curtissbacteria bacterium]